MIALKLERIGDQVVLVLDEAALAALNAQAEPSPAAPTLPARHGPAGPGHAKAPASADEERASGSCRASSLTFGGGFRPARTLKWAMAALQARACWI